LANGGFHPAALAVDGRQGPKWGMKTSFCLPD
jgi:hypothetical protein